MIDASAFSGAPRAGGGQFVRERAWNSSPIASVRIPYSSLSLTQMPGSVSQGWPSLVFLSSFSFLTPEEKSHLHMSPVAKILSDLIVGHETAHQWWGDLVSWKSYRDQWLFEALANYSALLMLESESPQHFRR